MAKVPGTFTKAAATSKASQLRRSKSSVIVFKKQGGYGVAYSTKSPKRKARK